MANSSGGVAAPPVPWIIKAMTKVHMAFHRLFGGRYFNSLGGDEVCFVEMKGARSGRQLTVPLMYVPYREGALLVASQGGAPHNPAWVHNLVKHPDVVVTHRGRRMELRARLATAEEKPQLWPICDEHYAPYATYRGRTERDIPIFVCEPAA